MRNKAGILMVVFFVFFCTQVFVGCKNKVSDDMSSSNYLFGENFAVNPIVAIFCDDNYGDVDVYFPNIGFTFGKRIVYDGSTFLLETIIPDSALAVLDKDELRLLRNTIYAKYGMIFQSDDLKAHFQKFSWYISKSNNVDAQLSGIDKWNLEKIQTFENAVPYTNLRKSSLVGFWATMSDAAGGDEIALNNNDTIFANIDRAWGPNWNWKGRYKIEDGFLVVLVTEQSTKALDQMLINNWRWPKGVKYSKGTITYNEPIRLVFPVSKSDFSSWDDGEWLKIGTVDYSFSESRTYEY